MSPASPRPRPRACAPSTGGSAIPATAPKPVSRCPCGNARTRSSTTGNVSTPCSEVRCSPPNGSTWTYSPPTANHPHSPTAGWATATPSSSSRTATPTPLSAAYSPPAPGPTLEKITEREQAVAAEAETARTQIEQLTGRLREMEAEPAEVATARKVASPRSERGRERTHHGPAREPPLPAHPRDPRRRR